MGLPGLTRGQADQRFQKIVNVKDLTYPLVIGHRGAANLAPENSLISYRMGIALGLSAVEVGDVRAAADGTLVAMHDTTIDRTAAGTGTISAMSGPGLARATLDSSSWFGGGWADQPLPQWSDAVNSLAGRCVIVPEVKDALDTTAVLMAKLIQSHGMTKSAIVQSFNLTNLQAIQSYGIATMFLSSTLAAMPAASVLTAAGVGFAGIAYTPGTDYSAFVSGMHAAGIKCVAYTVDRQYVWNQMLVDGFDAAFCNDPLYAPGASNAYRYRTATTTWHTDGTWTHGMSQGKGNIQGPFTASFRSAQTNFIGGPGRYRWPLVRNLFNLGGEVLPVPNPTGTYTITATFAIDAVGGDTAQGPSFYVCLPDDSFTSNAGGGGEPYTSYMAKLRATGNLATNIITSAGTTAQGSANTTAFSSPVLSGALTGGVAITSLPVNALTVALKSGHMFYMPDGSFVTVSASAAVSATSVSISSYTPASTIPSGTALIPRVQLKAVVSPTNVVLSRGDETSVTGVTITDTSARGAYLCIRQTADVSGAISLESIAIS